MCREKRQVENAVRCQGQAHPSGRVLSLSQEPLGDHSSRASPGAQTPSDAHLIAGYPLSLLHASRPLGPCPRRCIYR